MSQFPTPEDIARAVSEGVDAQSKGLNFKYSRNPCPCPYTYNNFPGMPQEDFNAYKRPLLDAWFRGYLGKEQSHG